MKRFTVLAAVLLVAAACSTPRAGTQNNVSVPGHGAISLTIAPNPVVAQKVGGTTYDFPFDVVVHETGGHAVTINRVTATMYAVGGIQLASDSYDAARIGSLGFSTSVPAGGELRYHFAPRRDVKDDRLFSSVYGDVRVDGTDDTGTATSATTRITVTR